MLKTRLLLLSLTLICASAGSAFAGEKSTGYSFACVDGYSGHSEIANHVCTANGTLRAAATDKCSGTHKGLKPQPLGFVPLDDCDPRPLPTNPVYKPGHPLLQN